MSIQQYSLTYGAMANMSTGDLTLEHEAEDIVWCRYSDVELLEERIAELDEGLSVATASMLKQQERIALLREQRDNWEEIADKLSVALGDATGIHALPVGEPPEGIA